MSAVVFSAKRPPAIRTIYVFGDSLSDTGTVFRASNRLYPPNPPYFEGRYSNGRVWVEYLAECLDVSQVSNFAAGGATTGSTSAEGASGNLVPGLLSQVQTFTQNRSEPASEVLYVLWAGANDYLQGLMNAALPVANIMSAIESLADIGATKFLVANLPDLGQLPATRDGANSSSLSALTQAHNLRLRRSLKVLQQEYSNLQIVTLDASSLYQQAITNPAQFGFTQVRSACLSGTGLCGNPDQFLFWDSIHPTTAGHRIIANTSVATLEAELQIPNCR